MNARSRVEEMLESLARDGVSARRGGADPSVPLERIVVSPHDWTRTAAVAGAMGQRFAGLWGDERADGFAVHSLYEGSGRYLNVQTLVPADAPRVASVAGVFAGAARFERHMRDLLGIQLDDADERRWIRHQAWREDEFPLRGDVPRMGQPPRRTPSDVDYPFMRIQGNGVYEIPVGPIHAGIIEPGHFRFQAVGEEVLRLETRLGYVHKGIEKLAVGRDPAGLARLAGRVSGDSTVAHAWAACQAMERATLCPVPPRALAVRAVLCERERITNHIGDIGAICNDVGFTFAHMQCSRLREFWQRRNAQVFGHRLLMDRVVPGGVDVDLDADVTAVLKADHEGLRRETARLFDVIRDHPSLDDRLIGTGILEAEDARVLGCTGYVGKASGQPFDVRVHAPYPPYDTLPLQVPTFAEGDVSARVLVRMEEIRESLGALDRLLDHMPSGPAATSLPAAADGAEGFGLIDGWRGEIVCFVRFDARGRIARFFPRDPSWFSWLALERLIHGNIVPDFPVCNKSVNASYSGHDL